MKKISVIVVTYNRLTLLKENLYHLFHQTYFINSIFVINNASTDGTKGYLNNLNDKRVNVINMKRNLGGAGGFSYGIKFAFEHTNSNYFWIMDDDAMPTNNASMALIKAAEKLNNKFGFLSSNVRWWKNNKASNVPVPCQNWSENISQSLIKIKEATFVSFFIPRKRVQELGLPISKAFIWGDDTEYTNRLSHKYPCYFVPDSIVLHKSKVLMDHENIFNEPYSRIPFYKCKYRNRLYIDRKYHPWGKFIVDLIIILIVFCKIPFKAKHNRLKRMYYVLLGVFLGFIFNPKIQFPKINKE